jgi:hypothetical protein
MGATTTFDREKMALAALLGFSLATEIADYLARAKVPLPKLMKLQVSALHSANLLIANCIN